MTIHGRRHFAARRATQGRRPLHQDNSRDVEDAVPYKKSIGTTQAGRRGRHPLHQDNLRDVSTSFLGVLRKDAIRNDIEEIGRSLALRLPVYN